MDDNCDAGARHLPARAHCRELQKQATEATTADEGRDWVAYWFAVPSGPALPEGGFLFALAEDWQALFPPDDLASEWRRVAARPAADWLALLLRPGQEPSGWDERWEKLTGLKAADLAGAFGGMGSQTVFGPRGSATVLSKATTIAAALFMLTSLSLSIIATSSLLVSLPHFLEVYSSVPVTERDANGRLDFTRHAAFDRCRATRPSW